MNHRAFHFSHVLAAKEIDFFLLPVYQHFGRRRFHQEKCDAQWNAEAIYKDFAQKIIASSTDRNLTRTGKLDLTGTKLLLRLEKDLFACLHHTDYCNEMQVFAPTASRAETQLKFLISNYTLDHFQKPCFHLASWNGMGLHLRAVALARGNKLNESEMELHYGSGFSAWHKTLVDKLTLRGNGLTILHGDPGTGKTTYLRHLIVALNRTHRFIFLPLDQARLLSELGSVDFWREQQLHDSERKLVVIMEDAEEFLLARDATRNNTRVADLLNIGDGLMGDYMQLHLICTLNCPPDALDRAITRSGRLLNYRRFERLTPEQARRIAEAEKLQLPEQPDYSLAEIYNGQNVFDAACPERRLGFAA